MGILGEAGFECFQPRGAYYIMTDVSTFGFPDDVTMAKYPGHRHWRGERARQQLLP